MSGTRHFNIDDWFGQKNRIEVENSLSLCVVGRLSLTKLNCANILPFFVSISDDVDSGNDWRICSPFTWTKAQVQSWLRWAWQHYNIPGEYGPQKLDLTGPELCVFTLEELKSRSEHGGEFCLPSDRTSSSSVDPFLNGICSITKNSICDI